MAKRLACSCRRERETMENRRVLGSNRVQGSIDLLVVEISWADSCLWLCCWFYTCCTVASWEESRVKPGVELGKSVQVVVV
jgi:hypothetical protein